MQNKTKLKILEFILILFFFFFWSFQIHELLLCNKLFYSFPISSFKERNDKLVIFIVTERAYLKKDNSVQKSMNF